MANYRKMYKQYYGIDFGREYHVHHIDCNHENDAIGNLVLLPAKLHNRYHFQKRIIESQNLPTLISDNALHGQSYYLTCLEEFIETLKECNKWYDYKMYLDGKIQNIHGIEL